MIRPRTVLLVQLDVGMDRLFLPLGLLYVGDALEKQGVPVSIVHEHARPENLDFLVQRVVKTQPAWVGFSVQTGPGLTAAIEASQRIKHEAPRVKVVWGGPHPTMIEGVDKEPYVDVAVRGPGEEWVTGQPMQHLDDFQPAWHLIDPHVYGPEIHLVTSRGCPHRCGFCYSPVVFKRRWRAHSVGKVIEIFRSYQDLCDVPVKGVVYKDDYFFADKRRAVEIVNLLGGPWSSTIRANDLRPDLLEQLRVLPRHLAMGVETASQRLLDLMRKDITLEDVQISFEAAERFQVPLFLTFIVGLPTETPAEREATIRMATEIQQRHLTWVCKVKKYRCYPGTYLYGLAVNEGFSPPQNTEEWAKYALDVWKAVTRAPFPRHRA